MPKAKRASVEELLASVTAKYDNDLSAGHGLEHTLNMLHSGLTEEAREKIPKGTKFLGAGVAAMGFEMPTKKKGQRGDVLRIQPGQRLATPWGNINVNRLHADEASALAKLLVHHDPGLDQPMPAAATPDVSPAL